MFSQFFVLSLRGDTILHKDCKYAPPLFTPAAKQASLIDSAPFCDRRSFNILVTNISCSSTCCVVRKDLEVVKYTSYNSTQEMFLAQVGIQNSFSEDQEGCQVPFFVSFLWSRHVMMQKAERFVC